jgi:hypothetical protein
MADYIRLVGWLLFCLTVEVFLLTVNFPLPAVVERLLSKGGVMLHSVEQTPADIVPPRRLVTDRVVMEDTGFDLP